jgi:hypothetical protein
MLKAELSVIIFLEFRIKNLVITKLLSYFPDNESEEVPSTFQKMYVKCEYVWFLDLLSLF